MVERDSVSMTAYYGYMHAFVNVFAGEMAMVRDLTGRLEGQTPLRAFGWQTALDRARGRATWAVARWAFLNERFGGKVRSDPFERRVYGQSPASVKKAAQTALELTEKLGSLNRFIDGVRAYDAEGVRWICNLADEVTRSVSAEAKSSSLVAVYLERGAPDGARQGGDAGEEEGSGSISSYFEAFFRAGDAFRAGLDG